MNFVFIIIIKKYLCIKKKRKKNQIIFSKIFIFSNIFCTNWWFFGNIYIPILKADSKISKAILFWPQDWKYSALKFKKIAFCNKGMN